MNKPTNSERDATHIGAMIRSAVEKGQSLTEIANRVGLSIPTISRIYDAKEGKVHPKTARAVVSALSPSGVRQAGRLSRADKDRILKIIVKTLQRELERL